MKTWRYFCGNTLLFFPSLHSLRGMFPFPVIYYCKHLRGLRQTSIYLKTATIPAFRLSFLLMCIHIPCDIFFHFAFVLSKHYGHPYLLFLLKLRQVMLIKSFLETPSRTKGNAHSHPLVKLKYGTSLSSSTHHSHKVKLRIRKKHIPVIAVK